MATQLRHIKLSLPSITASNWESKAINVDSTLIQNSYRPAEAGINPDKQGLRSHHV